MNQKMVFAFTGSYRPSLCVAVLIMAGTSCLAAEQYEVMVERNVAAKMRDGVVLRADIYRPKAEGKFPVLLNRTPYDKVGITAGMDWALQWAARGYVVIIQDSRGRYTSEGEWVPFKESQDGYDTVEWAAALPYSSGKVGMFGGSYMGATQLQTAIASPPHLAAIAPIVTASNYHDGWTYQGGAFEQWFSETWTSILAQNAFQRRVQKGTNALEGVEKLPLAQYTLFHNACPEGVAGAVQGDEQTRNLAPYFLDWLAHPSYDDYWKQVSIEGHFEKVMIPVYSIGAWYDLFLGGSLRNYIGIKAQGGSEAARHGQRLLVTIAGHSGGDGTRNIGDVDFGPQAVFNLGELMGLVRWYDHVLKGIDNGIEREKPVKLFVMGKNVWREEDDWPLARARSTRYYLHSNGKADGLSGDGALSSAAPQNEPGDRFVYDPADPVPTHGGPLCCDPFHLPAGPRDQRSIEARPDVLVFTTPPFSTDFEVTGPVSLELFASSTAVDTDFAAKLVDVWPNGFAQNLTEGILRACYRNGQDKVELMNPGEIYKFTIDLWATSNVFLAGHRLRLEVASSNFPRFDRNLNTGEDQAHATRMVKATNIVLHDSKHPSALILPVIPQ